MKKHRHHSPMGLFLSLAAAALLAGCQAGKEAIRPLPAGQPLDIYTASDLHYYAPSLTDNGQLFRWMLYNSDSKMPQYSQPIVEAFVAEVIAQNPAALVLSGDVTFNGEAESHRQLAQALVPVRQAGIPVLVIPGNHDINSPHPQQYRENKVEKTDAVTPEEFKALYFPLGAEDALSFDSETFSYLYPVAEDVYLLMLDASIYRDEVEDGGRLSAATLSWVESCLQQAERQGARVIAVSHQNLVPQFDMFQEGYVIEQGPQLLELYRQYGVQLHLSGHIHVQHIAQADGVYDIAQEALSLYPCQYGVVQLDAARAIQYSTRKTDVAAWAEATGSTDEKLLAFDETGEKFFYTCAGWKALEQIYTLPITVEQRTAMSEVLAHLNPLFFQGRLYQRQQEFIDSEGYALWLQYPHTTFSPYLESLLRIPQKDENQLFLPAV